MAHAHDSHHEVQGAEQEIAPLRLTSNFTDGGHEVDVIQNSNLFVFLTLLVLVIVGSGVGVYELFVAQTNARHAVAASAMAPDLKAKRESDATYLNSWGKLQKEGWPTTYHMPITEARKAVLANPSLLKPAAPPADWVHPDDVK